MDNQMSFLSLPQTIRNKIYCLSGLVRPCPIDLFDEQNRVALVKRLKRTDVELWEEPDHYRPRCSYVSKQKYGLLQHRFGNCVCQPLPLQLLYLSRILHHEVVSVLYGRNKISVTWRKPSKLDHLHFLETLSLHAWVNIRSLHIDLTATQAFTHLVPRYEVLDRRDSSGSELLTRWTAICALIAARITPFQLSLSLHCAVRDLETAIDVTGSMSQLPPLNKCSIHFGDGCCNQAIQSLAKASVLRLTKEDDERLGLSRSCWKNLPSELRVQILMETDLVRRRIPMKGLATGNNIEIEDGRLVPSTGMCCWQCSEALATYFCPASNATFSDTCVCFPTPTAIFRVSKLFNYEATKIFYSMNVFRLSGNMHATTQFLAGLPNPAVQNMRIIELQLDFEQLCYGLSRPGSPIARIWHDLIVLLRDRLVLSKVWLSILAIGHDIEYDFATLNDNGDHDYNWLHTTSFQLLKPLKLLKGLKKLHVSLCWSTDFEAVIEKAVMGPEYDSIAEGKPRYKASRALYRVMRMPMIEALAKTDM